MTRGIGEIGIGSRLGSQSRQGTIGSIMERRMVQDIRQQLLSIRSVQAPPALPTNVRVTPQAFAILIQWTRASDADSFELLISTTASSADAASVEVGNTSSYVDRIGDSGITHWYWVRSVKRNNGLKSDIVGGIAGTTLVSTAGVVPPTPPPPSLVQAIDLKTGKATPVRERQVADV